MAEEENPFAPLKDILQSLVGSDTGQLAVISVLVQALVDQGTIPADRMLAMLEGAKKVAAEKGALPKTIETIESVMPPVRRKAEQQ